jgi:hypothetical protein
MSESQGLAMWAVFIAGIVGIYTAVAYTYTGKPSVRTEYEGGLFEELGGAGAVRVGEHDDFYGTITRS